MEAKKQTPHKTKPVQRRETQTREKGNKNHSTGGKPKLRSNCTTKLGYEKCTTKDQSKGGEKRL